jgi:hypothetical protein
MLISCIGYTALALLVGFLISRIWVIQEKLVAIERSHSEISDAHEYYIRIVREITRLLESQAKDVKRLMEEKK